MTLLVHRPPTKIEFIFSLSDYPNLSDTLVHDGHNYEVFALVNTRTGGGVKVEAKLTGARYKDGSQEEE